jgi:hypothetical protein
VLASELGSASSASYARYLGADRGLASGTQPAERGLKDVFEACLRCDAGEGLDLNKTASGIGMWGHREGNGYSFAGSNNGGSNGGSGNGSGPSQAAGQVVSSLAAKGGLGNLSNDDVLVLLNLLKQSWEQGFSGGLHKGLLNGVGGSSSGGATPTPEPGTLLLVAGGMAAAAAIRRRQQRNRAAQA